ncbi:MAG: FeoC-like transcriptional regulator [Propionibacteriaceae bacterium]|jgi:hypothetical protein|nr:FeoC-like transcriptional regulator [Propionibacteriaceae bacterium]
MTAGPLVRVRAACASRQCRSTADIARRTGLPADVVAAVLDHLVATGELRAEALVSGCPATGCAACPVARSCPGVAPGRTRALTLVGAGVEAAA